MENNSGECNSDHQSQAGFSGMYVCCESHWGVDLLIINPNKTNPLAWFQHTVSAATSPVSAAVSEDNCGAPTMNSVGYNELSVHDEHEDIESKHESPTSSKHDRKKAESFRSEDMVQIYRSELRRRPRTLIEKEQLKPNRPSGELIKKNSKIIENFFL